MVISKKTIIFQGFIGGPTFSGGGSIFFKGESNANFYRNPYLYIKTCDFPGGGGGSDPLSPSESAHETAHRHRIHVTGIFHHLDDNTKLGYFFKFFFSSYKQYSNKGLFRR